MDEQDMDLHMRIKQFLSKDAQFRNPTFDPAPYLIQILKDKSADHQAMIQKQQQLIQLQNKAIELVDEICTDHNADFIKFLDIPALYAENLQKLKSNVSVVKKKVKQTKALLLNTQKDIQQIHYNCMFNKKVYKQLKKIQLRLQQYETAYLALKNNQFYLCALNLPFVEGLSILESTLASRAETLRLRMMSKAVDQLNLFLFFSPKVVLPSSNVLLDRMSQQKDEKNNMQLIIANWDQQQAFYKRYKLFKKANSLDYLTKIWEFSDLDRKQGKLGLVFDIVKGIIRIGRVADITQTIHMYGPKQIPNIFLLLKCFRIKQQSEAEVNPSKPKIERWFVDRCTQNTQDRQFIAATMNIIGVLFRKCIIVHKIYQQFQQRDYPLHSGMVYKHVLIELKKLIQLLYFPQIKNTQQSINEGNEQPLFEQIKARLSKTQNYINYGYSAYLIYKSLTIIQTNTAEIQQKQFENVMISKGMLKKGAELLAGYQQIFYTNFHRDFMTTLQQIFCKDGHSFIMESFQAITLCKPFKNDQIKYMKGYRSDDRKAIKEYILILSFMKSLQEFFDQNKLIKERLYKYLLMCLLFFYLKLNNHLVNNLISPGELLVIDQQRKADKKLRKKQQEMKRIFQKLLTTKQIKQDKMQKYETNNQKIRATSNIGQSFHTTDKLKIIQKQNQMILSFSCHFFAYVQDFKNGENVEEFIKLITKLEPANYDQQVKPKLSRVWDTLPDSEKSVKQYIAAVLYKLIQIQCIVVAKIYRETGTL